MDFRKAAVRFGQPGILRVANLGTAEPTSASSAWTSDWVTLGYTAEGSSFNYEVTWGDIDVAEEIDRIGQVPEARNVTIETQLVESTYRNFSIFLNQGIITDAAAGVAWTIEPTDLDDLVSGSGNLMLAWDAYKTTANNDLRLLWREVRQTGSGGVENRKGTSKRGFSMTFTAEKPSLGGKIMKIWGGASLNVV